MVLFSFVLVILVWLWPGIYFKKKNKINITHPLLFFPLFVVYTTLIPFSEYLFGWSAKFADAGLRAVSSEIILSGGNAYVITNLYLIISAIFYFLGVYIFIKGMPKKANFIRIQSIKFKKIKVKVIFYLLLLPLIIGPIIFFDINQSGNYFVSQVFGMTFYIPGLLALFNFYAFMFAFIIAIPTIPIILSKANIFYLFLWSIVPFDFIRYKIRFKKTLYVLSICLGIFLATWMIDKRDEFTGPADTNQIIGLFYTFFFREYSYDVFASDVYHAYNNDKINTRSYLFGEFAELIPSSIYETLFGEKKVRMGNLVGFEILREYKAADLGVGFNRHYLTSFYHDLGLIGVMIGSFIIGLMNGYWFKRNIKFFLKTNSRIYIARYLTIPLNFHYLINGAIFYFLINFVFMNVLISIFKITYKKTIINENPI